MNNDFQVPNTGGGNPPPLGAGALLRQAREAAGLHVAALAVSMKVPVKKLEALEAEHFGELADLVFVRALAASMCRALKIDAAPILRKLPQSPVPRLVAQGRGINRPIHAANPSIRIKAAASFVTRPDVLLILVLLLSALVLLLLPDFNSKPAETETAGAKPAPVDTTAVQTVKLETSPNTSLDTKPSAMPTAEVNQANEPASSSSSPSAPLPASVASQPAQAALTVSPVAPPDPTLVSFKASNRSWVRVADRMGKVQLEKTLAAGETADARGELPLSVVVGNVAATTVQVGGKAYSMENIAKDNVARFEVK